MAAKHHNNKKKPETSINQEQKKTVRNAHLEDMVDHYWGSMNYIFSLIKASEIKAGLILSFYGIIFNLIFLKIAGVLGGIKYDIPLYILLFLWLGCTAFSIYCCVRCFMPKIETTYDKNIFFFKDVISKFGDVKEFSKTFYNISLDEEELFDQMGQQIFVISKIAAAKFKFVNRAIRFLGIGLGLLFITVIYYVVSGFF